jgi:mannose-6-phosphate isomerase
MIRLHPRPLAKLWGRDDTVEHGSSGRSRERIGEIWYEAPGPASLLVKYLFTSERLSIQVHPDDNAARAMGLPHGKDEAWIVLDAEPGAVIGLGLLEPMEREQVRAAALAGSLEDLIDWRPVKAGDAIYSPAGTIHAIGAGLKLVEVQQNLDLTLRLYDYGRPRPLQLEEALDVAQLTPFPAATSQQSVAPGLEVIAEGRRLRVERLTGPLELELACTSEQPVWLVPLADRIAVVSQRLSRGEVWLLDRPALIVMPPDAVMLAASAA